MLHTAQGGDYVLYVNGADTKGQKKVSDSPAVKDGGFRAAAPTWSMEIVGFDLLADGNWHSSGKSRGVQVGLTPHPRRLFAPPSWALPS